MLSPELLTLEINPEMRKAIQDKVFQALFRSIHELPPRQRGKKGTPSLTVTEAKDRLAMALPEYRDVVGRALPVDWKDLGFTAVQMGTVLHEWINEASIYFRREGGDCIRAGLQLSSEEEFFQYVWNCLFSRKILAQAQSSEMLRDENGVQVCDLVIESLKKWARHVCSHLWGLPLIPSILLLFSWIQRPRLLPSLNTEEKKFTSGASQMPCFLTNKNLRSTYGSTNLVSKGR